MKIECPFRFPPDFAETLHRQHPLYSDIKEYVPVVDPQSPAQRRRTTDPVFVENADTTVVGETGLFDGDSDAEGDLVFLPEELDDDASIDGASADEGAAEASADLSAETAVVVQARSRRRRYCLEGCECERSRGRLCECEKRGDGMCGDECQCNPDLCRTIARGGESASADESNNDEEEEV